MRFDDPTPEQRARWVEAAVAAFLEMTHGEESDPKLQLSGVLLDLMEWAKRRKLDFDSALGSARVDYELNRIEEDDDE